MTSERSNPSNDRYFIQAYEELRRAARRVDGARGSLTWNPTALVNEAYLRLAKSTTFEAESSQHLKHAVIRAMKFILVEKARQKAAARRGGGSAPTRKVPLDESAAASAAFDPRRTIAIALALDELEKASELQARVFECQFFGGLEVAEIASLMGISEKKAQRTLRLARAQLSLALDRSGTV